MKLREEAEMMQSMIGFIEKDPELRKIWLAKDRGALYQLARPIFERLRNEHQVTHFYFTGNDRVNFLRVHNRPRYGDEINWFTQIQAQLGNVSHGIELGKFGTFTLRVVVPWRFDGNIEGYIELGMEIKHFLSELKNVLGGELMFVINKKYLNQKDWEEGQRMMGRTGNWDRFDGFVVVSSSSILMVPLDLPCFLNLENGYHSHSAFKITIDEKSYMGKFNHLLDVSGNEVGNIIVFSDVTKNLEDLELLSIAFVVASVVSVMLLLIIFNPFLGRIENTLTRFRCRMEELVVEKTVEIQRNKNRLEQAQSVAQLGHWDWDMKTKSLTCSREIFRIFGVSHRKVLPSYAAFLKRVHPKDKIRVKKAMLSLLRNGGSIDLDFQIVMSEGMRYIHLLGEKVRNEKEKVIRYSGILQDITDRKHVEEQIRQLSRHDPLTKLPNRTAMKDFLQLSINRAERFMKGKGGKENNQRRNQVAVMMLDLDRFKPVNDELGHAAGDELLKQVARRLKTCIRKVDQIARLGGDEFTVILQDSDLAGAAFVAIKIKQALEEPFLINGKEVFIGVSIGISMGPDDGNDVDVLLDLADRSLYFVKEEIGRGHWFFFSPGMRDKGKLIQEMSESLSLALKRSEFVLHYQGLVDAQTKHIIGAEAFLRWNRPDIDGLILPNDFVLFAREQGLLPSIEKWVIRTACHQMVAWLKEGCQIERTAVNLHDVYPGIAETVKRILDETGLAPSHLELKIAEPADKEDLEEVFNKLKKTGIWISIGNFGTGNSSITFVRTVRPHGLKVDRSLVQNMLTDERERNTIASIIAFAHSLQMQVTAEGVENWRQSEELQQAGCDMLQGYIFGRAVPEDQFVEMLQA